MIKRRLRRYINQNNKPGVKITKKSVAARKKPLKKKGSQPDKMSLSDKLNNDMKNAMKSGDKNTLSVIRMVRAAVKNREIQKGDPLSDEEVREVLMSQAKQMKESIAQFSKAGRQDLVDKEKKELEVIRTYLPRQLSEEELVIIVKEVIKEIGAEGPVDMGKAMKAVMSKVKGQADGRLVSEAVKKFLANGS